MGGVGELKHVGTHVMEGDIFQPDDDQVQRLIIQGAYRPALERLIHSYQHLIVRYCVTMLGDTGYGDEIARRCSSEPTPPCHASGRRPRSAPGSWRLPASNA